MIKKTETHLSLGKSVKRIASLLLLALIAACDSSTSLVGQPSALCRAARNAGADIEDWKAYGHGFGYACVADENFIGDESEVSGLYTKVGLMVVGEDESRMDHIDLYADLGNPDTADQGLALLATRVKSFLANVNAPVPTGLVDAVRARREFSFQTPLGSGRVFVDDGRVPSVLVQIVRLGIPFDRRS